jgi:hypothetical protein
MTQNVEHSPNFGHPGPDSDATLQSQYSKYEDLFLLLLDQISGEKKRSWKNNLTSLSSFLYVFFQVRKSSAERKAAVLLPIGCTVLLPTAKLSTVMLSTIHFDNTLPTWNFVDTNFTLRMLTITLPFREAPNPCGGHLSPSAGCQARTIL